MQTTLTGQMDSAMVEDVTKALERFSGREVKIRIEILAGKKPKANPPITQPSKNAPVGAANFIGEADRSVIDF